MKKVKKITKRTTLGDIMEMKGSFEVLSRFRVPCIQCPFAAYEMGKLSIGDVAKYYGIDADALVKELNRKLKKGKK